MLNRYYPPNCYSFRLLWSPFCAEWVVFVSEIIIYLAVFPLIFSNCDIYQSITDTGIKGRLQLAISISTLSVCNYLLIYRTVVTYEIMELF
jgi:hypothetical protein